MMTYIYYAHLASVRFEHSVCRESLMATYIYIYISKKSRNTNGTLNFKTAMLKSNLCGYGDANILVKGNVIIVANTQAQPQMM